MLNIDSSCATVPHSEFFAIMSMLRRVFVDKDEYELIVEQEKAKKSALEKLMLEYMNFYSDNRFDKFSLTNLRVYLIEYEDVSENLFLSYNRTKRQQIPSMDSKILDRLNRRNISPYLLGLYTEYQQMNSKINNLASNLNSLLPTKFTSKDKRPLHAIPFYYDMQSTGRLYSKCVDVQGWPLPYVHLFLALDDYFFIWGDFSQIDLRVALELCLMGDERLKINIEKFPDDRYKAFAYTMYSHQNLEFDEDKFVSDRETAFKPGILAPIYGMSEDNVISKVSNSEIGKGIYRYINNNDTYKDYKRRVKENINLGLDFYCETYFGTKMPISVKKDNAMTAALNKPIQGTSGDIMKIVTVEIYRRMQKHVKDKNLFLPLLNRHDETVYLCHKSVIKYLYEFLDCTDIQIDDWAPFKIKWSAGYRYKEDDENLINTIIEENKNIPRTNKILNKRKENYHATPEVLVLSTALFSYAGISVLTFAEFEEYKMRTLVQKGYSISKSEIVENIEKYLEIDFSQYDRVIIYSEEYGYIVKEVDGKSVEFIFVEVKEDNNLVRYTRKINYGILCRYFKNVIGVEPDDSWLEQADLSEKERFKYKCLNLT